MEDDDAGGCGPGFEKIPAVTVKNGHVVLTREGEYFDIDEHHPAVEDIPKKKRPPSRKWGYTLWVFEKLYREYDTVYVLDHNGIVRNSPQLDLLRRIGEFGTLWVDSGSWKAEHGMDLLMVGVEGSVMATKTTRGMHEIRDACDMFEEVIVSIDYDGRLLARSEDMVRMDPVEFAKEAASLGVQKFVFADLRRTGVDEGMVKELVRHCPELYVGGGVKDKHCHRLQGLGAKGAVLELTDVLEGL